MATNDNYDKIKHLVEVDDDILAVFLITFNQIKESYIAKNSSMDKNNMDYILNELIANNENEKSTLEDINSKTYYLLGKKRWVVLEYEKLRILKIYEPDNSRIVVVLMNSNIQLEHTVDNVLGYYYDTDEIPKSLF